MPRLMNKNMHPTRFSTSLKDCLPNSRTGVESISIIVPTNTFRRYMRGNNLSDLRKDWQAVGGDLRRAISKYSM